MASGQFSRTEPMNAADKSVAMYFMDIFLRFTRFQKSDRASIPLPSPTYINLKLNKGYVEKINAAQEIVKTQKATITDLTKELQDMVDSMQKLSTNKAAEHEISNKMADIINTTIEKTNSTIQDITDNQNSYNALVDKYDKENANNETAN
jgi:uncharacterized protein YoxC